MGRRLTRGGAVATAALLVVGCTGTIGGKGGGGAGSGGEEGIGSGNLPTNDDPVGATQGKLEITEPARGAMIPGTSGATVRVAGRVLDFKSEDLTINELPVDVASDGTFAVDVPATAGLNVISARVSGFPGARAQRSFLFGDFAPAGADVARAIGLRVNREGLDDGDGDLDDLASLTEAALADRDLIKTLPASYSVDAPVVGRVSVRLTERSTGRPQIDFTPRAGGISVKLTFPNLRLRHELSFSCVLTTCHATGTATADAAVVTVELDLSLDGDAIVASPRSAKIDLVGFRNREDGTLASIAQDVVEFFIPNLVDRIENTLSGAATNALPDDVSLALSQLALPATLDLRPAIDAQLTIGQRFDAVDFAADGGTVSAAAHVTGPFEAGDPGEGAPGSLRLGSDGGEYRTDPAFGLSTALDLINQTQFAVWGQGVMQGEVPGGIEAAGHVIGAIQATALTPPVLTPDAGGALRVSIGDLMLDTTMDGVATRIAVTIVSRAELVIDTGTNLARIEPVSDPAIYAELLTGPADLPGTIFSSLVESSAPPKIAELLSAVTIPLPAMPLDAVAPSLAGKTMRIAPPAEVVTGAPPAQLTFYGRLAAQ